MLETQKSHTSAYYEEGGGKRAKKSMSSPAKESTMGEEGAKLLPGEGAKKELREKKFLLGGDQQRRAGQGH